MRTHCQFINRGNVVSIVAASVVFCTLSCVSSAGDLCGASGCGEDSNHDNCISKLVFGEFDATADGAYSQLFYNNDFSYLKNRCPHQQHLGDRFKNLSAGPHVTVDFGGEYRARYHHEANLRSKPLSGRTDDFLLHRTRLYADVKSDRFRIYAEAIDATSDAHRFQPRATEVNRFDAINLFADGLLLDSDSGKLWLRGGRQEMTFGSQRLVSNRPWRNTTVAFDGFRGMWRTDDADVDVFWTRPISFGQHLPHDHNFDNPDQSRQFFGGFLTLRPADSETLDVYYFGHDENAPSTQGNGAALGPFSLHTIGGRYDGQLGELLTEFEAAYQFGDLAGATHSAAMFVAGAGYKFTELPWTPTLWAFYDWASGDSNPSGGNSQTFRQLFPRGHYYLGFADVTGRQNVEDFNLRLQASPTGRLALTVWWHVLNLENRDDAVYSPGGAPIYHDPSGSAGSTLGQELDISASWTHSPRLSYVVGYSRFFAGSYFDSLVIQNGPAGLATNGASGKDGTLVYVQAALKF